MSRALPTVLLASGLVLGGGPAVAADRGLVLVELYTSQGCSSCPPADALLSELAQRTDVLPLALHVDYWDYIGWADEFASPDHTLRQKAYARGVGSRSIFTPQFVIAGTDHVVGLKPMQVERLIQKNAEEEGPVALSVTRKGEEIVISAKLDAVRSPGPMLVQLVKFDPHETVAIKSGENSGLTVDYTNIVEDWQVLAAWNGAAPFTTSVATAGPVAVVVQIAGPGEVLAVARVD